MVVEEAGWRIIYLPGREVSSDMVAMNCTKICFRRIGIGSQLLITWQKEFSLEYKFTDAVSMVRVMLICHLQRKICRTEDIHENRVYTIKTHLNQTTDDKHP